MESLERFSKWVQLKKYQMEVTFAVYIFTPTEKFIFYSLIFLLFGLSLIATILYLPQHIVFLLNRVWWYINGDESELSDVVGFAADAAQNLASKGSVALAGTASASSSSLTAAAAGAASVVREL